MDNFLSKGLWREVASEGGGLTDAIPQLFLSCSSSCFFFPLYHLSITVSLFDIFLSREIFSISYCGSIRSDSACVLSDSNI
jgi:hypothetical protein